MFTNIICSGKQMKQFGGLQTGMDYLKLTVIVVNINL